MKRKRLTILGLLLALILSVGIFVATPVFAQEVDIESFAEAAGFSTDATISVIIARLIRTAITLVGVVTVAFIVYGGFVWMTAGGDTERAKKAKKILTNAFIGLLIVFASFAIVSFVLGALVTATGGDITVDGGDDGDYPDGGGGSSVFYLSSVNNECAESLQNLQLQFIFSKSVDSDTVEEGIVIADSTGTSVDGTFSTSSRTVTFTPSTACESPYETEFCFDASSDYTIEVDSSVIESSAGSSLTCTTTYPCTFSFTTGTQVDIDDPTVEMDAPDDGESLYAGSIEKLQASTWDDSGVSSVDFYVIDDDEAIYTSGVNFSTAGALTGGSIENVFYTDDSKQWDTTVGYTTNESYDIWSTGYDCAGNTDTAERVSIMLRAASCNNGVQDEDLGETGSCEDGEDCDCGGDSTSAYYCGACDGDECTENSDCSSGQCVDGQCETTPKIKSVSPGDGASGNLVTISGKGFGDDEGVITFLGTESGDEVVASTFACDNGVQWSDEEVVVQVPAGAKDGPISLKTAGTDAKTDRTDDDYGPSIADFDVNAIIRPGICALVPKSDDSGSSIDVFGTGFGDEQGSSTLYFTNYETSSYVSWSGAFLEVVVPNVNAGKYLTQVFTGDYFCVDTAGALTGDSCSDDDDCDADAGESCATAWCSETLDYCDEDDDCSDDGGSCESIRVGSNQVAFTVKDVSSETTPIISYIDSGWKACSDDDSVHCGDDDDCGDGATCEDALNWGPSGQYITIYGTGFGTATGSVFFENVSRSVTALGDTDFPDVCGEDFWHDTYITVKVPESYQTDEKLAIEAPLTHSLYVERVSDGAESDPTDFVVLDDTPGPAICDIAPSSAPAGEKVTVYGENFGTSYGTVTFYSVQEADYTQWENDEITKVVVPDDAANGPVYVTEAENSYTSNSITFTIGDCREEDADFCATGETCCDNGACDTSCETQTEVEAHYAFMISTGITPNTPNVVVSCSESGTSPTPWEGWSQPEDICVTASVEAEFDMAMNQDTITTSTVVVRKCTVEFTSTEESDGDEVCSFSGISCDDDEDCTQEDEECLAPEEGECKSWEVVAPFDTDYPKTDETGFAWSPEGGEFETSTLYRVTLQGEDQIASEAGGYMEEDYQWEFTTSSSGEPCEVGDVNVRPYEYTETEQTEVDYSAQLIAANDMCVAVSCSGYSLSWGSDFDGAAFETLGTEPGLGICTNEVSANEETVAGTPATITATVDAENRPSDDGYLTINFLDPEIDDYFPQCSTACVNALPWGEFNTRMDGGTIGASSITLYECLNSLCETLGLTEFADVASVSFSGAACEEDDDSSQIFYINFEVDSSGNSATMDPNTWYRVVLEGDAVLSCTGVALSESGSNYGTDENRYFEDDFSWVFKTKDDAVSCSIDSITLDPDVADMSYIGQRAEFDATAKGAPDDCSSNGQTLQSGSYEWEAWSAIDNPNNVGSDSGSWSSQNEIVAYMILDGAIELTTDIPAYCTSACLNAGAPVTTAEGVCGNGSIEDSEECDDGGVEDDDGCSSSCLNEGNTQCPATCDGSGASCTNDASCEESCESAVCSSASDVDEACTLDADCDSGSCSQEDVCEDYEDAASSCTNNGACDSGSCVGSCSITGDSCSGSDVDCLYATGDTCELSGSGCCGDGSIDGSEDCDDSNLTSGDGCSSICLNEGSRSVSATCGDGVQDWAANTGGEDCDDGNLAAGDGCSRNCLIEGSTSEEDVYAICGDGTTCSSDTDCGSDETCNDKGQCVEYGEDCDPGAYDTEDDGCSSACLYEGSPTCPSSDSDSCCGNDDIEPEAGEECDGDKGCSSSCLWAGSSYSYSTPSFCGDGKKGIGEECDALSTASFSVGDYSVAQVAKGAAEEVDDETNYAISTVSVKVDGDVKGDATLQLQCVCTTDASCGEEEVGCGQNNCCFERPTIVDGKVNPADNVSSFKLGGEGYCRNTAVWLEFSDMMDKQTFDKTVDTDKDGIIDQDEFDANLYLDLVSIDSNGDGNQEKVEDITDCPKTYDGGKLAVSKAGRFWNWLKQLVLGLFGKDANASEKFACHVPVTYELSENTDGSVRAYLRYSELLEENAIYQLTVIADNIDNDTTKDGVLSEHAVTLCIDENCTDEYFKREFAVGDDICDLDRVLLEDQGKVPADEFESLSIQTFSSKDEKHAFVSTPQTYHAGSGYEEISPLKDLYEWEWAWTSSKNDDDEEVKDIVADVDEDPQDTSRYYTASGNSGREHVISSATISVDELFSPTTAATATTSARTVTGKLEVTAFLCENPWPSLDSETLDFPYIEDDVDLPSNFSFYYCRDDGETGTDDDLSNLKDPIDVSSLSSSGIIRELIFKVEDSNDAIGVRVIANEEYLSPSAWVESQEFTGTFSETELDRYPAVEAGNTLYAAAANVSGGAIYPNIYIISYNENTSSEAQEIFDQILDNWSFNANSDEITDVNLCVDTVSSSYELDDDGEYVECDWDGDCYEEFEDITIDCDTQKGKLTRDMIRLLDVVEMATTIDAYGDEHGHCSVTKGQSCDEDDDCSGSEECVAGYPSVQSGTFVPALSNSIWSSWSASLGNELGTALPTDPVNEFFDCSDEGYDVASCWNGEEGTFICPEYSHLYGYQSVGGEEYILYTQLEMSGNYVWEGDIDLSATDNVTIVAEYPSGNAPANGVSLGTGFESTPQFCDGGMWGDSALCGDGTQGITEACEVGDTMIQPCVDSSGDAGVITVACYSDATLGCTGYQTVTLAEAAGAECSAYSCGNAVKEIGEECDDGSLNGTYGHCSDTCKVSGSIYCGDGYLASSEQCDCGTTSTYSTVIADTSSWAYLNLTAQCGVSNGQYDVTSSCAYNCTSPGLICGDGRVNGSEVCDGDYEDWEGALCSDGTVCTTDADCDSGICGDGGAACGVGDICTDWDDAGKACTSSAQCDSGMCTDNACTSASDAGDVCTSKLDCDSGVCGDFNYDLFRYRTCSSSCTWGSGGGWSGCVGGTQICGNGIVEGNEACDDGNSTNNDECLNTCVENVCGDDYVYVGVESCDDGNTNGTVCSADYEDTCNYCNVSCQYKTASGGYCGDGVVDDEEICDGGYATTLNYFDATTQEKGSTCTTYDGMTSEDSIDYTCRWLGVCNGGEENGEYCTLDYSTYVSSGKVNALKSEEDTNGCGAGIDCVAPICADDCGSSCPFGYETTGLLVQSESAGASASDSIKLFSYLNDEGDSPDNGVVYVPACNVATSMTADIDDTDVVLPTVDIVFVTDLSGSMGWEPDSESSAAVGYRRIDYVVEATEDAIEYLFDAYGSSDSIQIGLVSFSESIDDASKMGNGYVRDVNLSDYSLEAALTSALEGYLSAIGDGTTTFNGLEEAISMLESSSAEVKIVVLLSDGAPSLNQDFFTEHAGICNSDYEWPNYPDDTKDWTNLDACVAEIADLLIDGGTEGVPRNDITFYTAAITHNKSLISYMSHISSNTCSWDDIRDVDECEGSYAYTAQSAQEITDMYQEIVDSILGSTVTFTATDDIGATTVSSGTVQAGSDVTLPFPEGFVCQSSEQTIPIRNTFYGSGSLLFSDFTFTYCPYE